MPIAARVPAGENPQKQKAGREPGQPPPVISTWQLSKRE
jgi:hypothetical protein